MEPISSKFEVHMQELEKFQEKHSKAFKVKSATSFVLPESSFSLLSSKERKELSTIYFHLAKAIIENGNILEDKRLQALDYLNTSISLDAMCNKEAYNMVAKIYATNSNPIGACANVLISMTLGEISRKNEFFIQQCKGMPFPIPQDIRQHNISKGASIDTLLFKDTVLILEPGTYTITIPIMGRNIVIIGIGEVTIKNSYLHVFSGNNNKLVLYNIHVECTQAHSLYMDTSQVFIDNCWFTKCSGVAPPICIMGRKALLSMNKCVVANSTGSGGILVDTDAKAIITNCEIHNIGLNSLEVRYGSSLYAEKNYIHHNKQGVLIWLDAIEVTLIDNVVCDNRTEGILINGNREPALSIKINGILNESPNKPPPPPSYTKPSQTVAVLQKNQILRNGSFGISVDFQAKVRLEENEIAASGTSGCIIKGGVDASVFSNNIHHNRSHGIEIGLNYHGKVIVENNNIHSNRKENILQLSDTQIMKLRFTPAKMINNKIGDDSSDEPNFVDFNVTSNRPGMHLFYEEEPYLYAIGNTYGFNLLNNIGTDISDNSYMAMAESCNTQKVENKQVSIFLGGIGDLRNIVETVHGLTKSFENHTKDYNINLLFTINDFNPTVLARDLVLLEMINRLPDPKTQSFTNRGLYSQWNKDFIVGATQVLSVWAEKIIDVNTSRELNSCIHSLIKSIENTVDTNTKRSFNSSNKKLPSWISFKYSLSTASSILQTLRCWQENSTTAAALDWNTKQMEILKHPENPEAQTLKNLKKHYCVDEDVNKYTCCQLPVSIQAQSYDDKHEIISSGAKHREVNVTMLTVPTMEYNVYPTSCIFRAFQITTKKHEHLAGDQPLTLYDHLLLDLLPKLMSLRASLFRTSSIQMQVMPILGDTIDTLLCHLPSSVRFNVIDCSNLADYVSLLNILLAAAPRLKDNFLLTLQLMKLSSQPSKPMKEFVEDRLGISLAILTRLTGITFVNAYYQDYAVYATWNFDITCKAEDKETKPDTLITDVISVATACCIDHTNRIKGLSINILIRLFQIMITRFPETTMAQLLRSFFESEGFKHVPNFAMHLVELKTFMTLHLSWSMVLKLEEFKDLKVSIARYTVKWLADNMEIAKIQQESEIWLRLIKPTSSGGAKMQKKKGKNILNDQEPTYYYFDSVSLSATNAPAMTLSFHLPVPFYDTHKSWILECNIGSVTILPAAKKFTLSEATRRNLYHDIWIDASTTEDSNKTEDNKETDENVKTCKHCGKTSDLKCSKCKLVYYCSRDCQKKDWKRHKMEDCIGHEVTQKNLHHDTR